MGVYFVGRIKIAQVHLLVERQNELTRLVHRYLHLRLTYIDLLAAKQKGEIPRPELFLLCVIRSLA